MNLHDRQGDILTVVVDSATLETPIKREGGAVVLAHGEVTNHKHAFYDTRGVSLHQGRDDHGPGTFLRIVKTEALLKHEEHTQIPHAKGLRRVIRQTEYSPEELRRVAD